MQQGGAPLGASGLQETLHVVPKRITSIFLSNACNGVKFSRDPETETDSGI